MLAFNFAPCEPKKIIDTNVAFTGANRRLRRDVVVAIARGDARSMELTNTLDQVEDYPGVLAAHTVVEYLKVTGPDADADVFAPRCCAQLPARQQRSLRMLRSWLHPEYGDHGALVESFLATVTPRMGELLNPNLVVAWLRAYEDADTVLGRGTTPMLPPRADLNRLLTDPTCCGPESG